MCHILLARQQLTPEALGRPMLVVMPQISQHESSGNTCCRLGDLDETFPTRAPQLVRFPSASSSRWASAFADSAPGMVATNVPLVAGNFRSVSTYHEYNDWRRY